MGDREKTCRQSNEKQGTFDLLQWPQRRKIDEETDGHGDSGQDESLIREVLKMAALLANEPLMDGECMQLLETPAHKCCRTPMK